MPIQPTRLLIDRLQATDKRKCRRQLASLPRGLLFTRSIVTTVSAMRLKTWPAPSSTPSRTQTHSVASRRRLVRLVQAHDSLCGNERAYTHTGEPRLFADESHLRRIAAKIPHSSRNIRGSRKVTRTCSCSPPTARCCTRKIRLTWRTSTGYNERVTSTSWKGGSLVRDELLRQVSHCPGRAHHSASTSRSREINKLPICLAQRMKLLPPFEVGDEIGKLMNGWPEAVSGPCAHVNIG